MKNFKAYAVVSTTNGRQQVEGIYLPRNRRIAQYYVRRRREMDAGVSIAVVQVDMRPRLVAGC